MRGSSALSRQFPIEEDDDYDPWVDDQYLIVLGHHANPRYTDALLNLMICEHDSVAFDMFNFFTESGQESRRKYERLEKCRNDCHAIMERFGPNIGSSIRFAPNLGAIIVEQPHGTASHNIRRLSMALQIFCLCSDRRINEFQLDRDYNALMGKAERISGRFAR